MIRAFANKKKNTKTSTEKERKLNASMFMVCWLNVQRIILKQNCIRLNCIQKFTRCFHLSDIISLLFFFFSFLSIFRRNMIVCLFSRCTLLCLVLFRNDLMKCIKSNKMRIKSCIQIIISTILLRNSNASNACERR